MRLEYVCEGQDGCIDFCRDCWAKEGCDNLDPHGNEIKSEWLGEFFGVEGCTLILKTVSPDYISLGYHCLCCNKPLTHDDEC